MGEATYTTAEIQQVFNLSGGSQAQWGFRAVTDRRIGTNGLTKGKEGPYIVDSDLPTLLRTIADFMEQEGVTTLEGYAAVMREKLG